MSQKGEPPEQAIRAFTLRYGHVPLFGPEHLHEPLQEYGVWLKRQARGHSRELLRFWIERCYNWEEARLDILLLCKAAAHAARFPSRPRWHAPESPLGPFQAELSPEPTPDRAVSPPWSPPFVGATIHSRFTSNRPRSALRRLNKLWQCHVTEISTSRDPLHGRRSFLEVLLDPTPRVWSIRSRHAGPHRGSTT